MTTAIEKDKPVAKVPASVGGLKPGVSLGRYMSETRAELAKVTWPTREHVLSSLLLILIVVTFYAVVVAGGDGLFTALLKLLQR